MSIACTYRGVGYGFELPTGYQECEYLESTGTQWIDTDLPVKYSRVICKAVSRSKINDNHMFGWRHAAAGCVYHLTYWSSSWSWGNGSGNFIDYTAPEVSCLSPHVFDLCASDETSFLIDGEVKATTTLDFSKFQDSYMLCFFARRNTSTIQYGKWLIYWANVLDTRDGTWHLIIPALDPLGVPCMYDTVSRKTFYNAGTGTFNYRLKPLPFPNGYKELEYLESTGTQYIDTEVKASYLGEWVLDAQLTNISITSCQINGVYTAGDISMDIGTYQNCWLLKNGGYAWMDSTKRAHDNLRHKFILSQIDKFGSIDGEVYVNSNCYVDVSKYPNLSTVWLFNRNSPNGEHYLCYEKIYSSTMKNRDGVLIQNLLPYLDPVGEPCMVDILTGKPYYNVGTGTFLYKIKD